MLNAQEYLDKNYPLEKRVKIDQLNINHKQLIGSLEIKNWPNLREIKCWNNNLTKLTITDLPFLSSVECSWNKLNILVLTDLPRLNKVDCRINQIASLNIKNCLEIAYLNADSNQLKNLSFLDNLSHEKLIHLDISHNNQFLPQDLSIFSRFVNLQVFNVSSKCFFGSLESLKNLKKLERFSISAKVIRDGLEYLPDSLKQLDIDEYDDSCQVILCKNEKDRNFFDLCSWRQSQKGYKKLKEILTKINPNLDIQEIIKQFEFFNVRDGSFQGNLESLEFLFQQRKEGIFSLEKTLEELIYLVKRHKEKIIQAYICFAPQKELLKELITTHITYRQTIRIKGDEHEETICLWRRKKKIYEELKNKLGGNLEEEEILLIKVDSILEECDKLTSTESELEDKLTSTIKFAKEVQIDHQWEKIIVEGHAFFGRTTIGNSANFSQRKTTTDIIESLNAQTAGKRAFDKEEEINLVKKSKKDWTDIHKDFTEEWAQEWINQGFTYQQVQDWANAFGEHHFDTANVGFIIWLRDIKYLTPEQLLNTGDLEQLKSEYQEQNLIANMQVDS